MRGIDRFDCAVVDRSLEAKSCKSSKSAYGRRHLALLIRVVAYLDAVRKPHAALVGMLAKPVLSTPLLQSSRGST